MGYKMDICQVAALRIRKMRLEKNMTIDDLAEKCDVSTQTIKLIEAGRRNFKIKTLYTIANSLNTHYIHIMNMDMEYKTLKE